MTARGPGGRDIKLEQHLVRVRAASVGAVFLKRLSGPNGYGRGLAAAAARQRECGGAATTVRLQQRRCSLGFARVPEFGYSRRQAQQEAAHRWRTSGCACLLQRKVGSTGCAVRGL